MTTNTRELNTSAISMGMHKLADKAANTGYSTKTLIGIGCSVIGSIFGLLGVFGDLIWKNSNIHFMSFLAIGFLFGMLSYLLAGGLGHAIKCSWSIAKFTWFLIPYFPVDVLLGFCGLVLGLMIFTAVPVVFVMKAVHEKYGK